MKVLPVAIATGLIHSGIITGKLNGVMPATTPTGWRNEYTSMPVAACSENSPLSSCGIPHANSTTSRPRAISPLASEMTLPCSRLTIAASSSVCSTSSSRNRNRIALRLPRETWDQVVKAAAELAMTRSTSSGVACASSARTSPVAGLWMGEVFSRSPRKGSPSIQCGTVVVIMVSFVVVAAGAARSAQPRNSALAGWTPARLDLPEIGTSDEPAPSGLGPARPVST